MLTQRTPTSALSASRGRSAEIHHLHTAAGYEAGVREPGCWDHIGRHMRADAEPVRLARRPARQQQPGSTLSRICMAVMLLSIVAAAVRACGGAA